MDRLQRQERQSQRGDQNRDHIAEVAGNRHLEILVHIGKGLSALDDAVIQNIEILFQKDDVSHFLGNIDSRIHGDTDIRLF